MSTIRDIIRLELTKRLERDALSQDINKAIDYINDWIGGIKYPALSDIEDAINGFVHDNYMQCEICGKYYDPEDLEECYYKRVCSDMFCKKQAQEDYEFDPHKEWGTY